MKLLPSWLRPRSAPSPDLREQLTAAEAALATAQERAAQALGRFDDTGDATSAKELLTARESEQAAALHVERAQRLLVASLEREAEERKAGLRSERDALLARLEPAAVDAAMAPHRDAQRELFLQLADLDQRQCAAADELATVARRVVSIDTELGEQLPNGLVEAGAGSVVHSLPLSRRPSDVQARAGSMIPIAESLERRASELGSTDPKAATLRGYADSLRKSRSRSH